MGGRLAARGSIPIVRRRGGQEGVVDDPCGRGAVGAPLPRCGQPPGRARGPDGAQRGGAVAAGSRVDVYATGGTSTDVLASGVLVLATSASAQESTTDAKVSWITVAVAPESVQEIVAAAQKTELYFTLPGSEGER